MEAATRLPSKPMHDEEDMNRLDNALSFQQNALGLLAQRQALIASNIANADTPNYKARDMDFKSALAGAMQGRSGVLALSTTAPGHITASSQAGSPYVGYRRPEQASADGNTVEMDVERAAFAESALRYQASINFITGTLRSMQTAVSGTGG
jgi:flagellar basal-body rod protein FlgB